MTNKNYKYVLLKDKIYYLFVYSANQSCVFHAASSFLTVKHLNLIKTMREVILAAQARITPLGL